MPNFNHFIAGLFGKKETQTSTKEETTTSIEKKQQDPKDSEVFLNNPLRVVKLIILFEVLVSILYVVGLFMSVQYKGEGEQPKKFSKEITQNTSFILDNKVIQKDSVNLPIITGQKAHVYATLGYDIQILAVSLLLSCSALLIGIILGFLIGSPRTKMNIEDAPKNSVTVTTNNSWEKISDWATGLVVGLGLIQLNKFPILLKNINVFFNGLFVQPFGGTFAISLIITLFLLGFIVSYLFSRVHLPGLFLNTDKIGIINPEKLEEQTMNLPTSEAE